MKENLIKGALLHDIGKLIMRATAEKKNHSEVGVEYLKNKNFSDEVISCVKYHHAKAISNNSSQLDKKSILYFVYQADNISSMLDRRDNVNDYIEAEWKSDVALKTIFSSFKKDVSSDDYYYPLRDLNPDNSINYPVKEILATSDRYSALKKTLDAELNSNLSVNSMLELLESTMSFVPSSVNMKQNADISLFDHSKTTAMIASCLAGYCEENKIDDYKKELFTNVDNDKKYYMLVSGDISGVQDFIYTISSKGALKSLRARSFYLDMVLEHIVDEILEYTSYTRANLMYNGGGHFYMLLPNTASVKAKLDEAMSKINQWLIDEFGVDLYLAVAYEEASSNDLMNTKNIFKNISLKLSKEKQSRYSKTQLKQLMQPQKLASKQECSICRTSQKETKEKSSDLGHTCETCYNLYQAGKSIINDDVVISVVKKNQDGALRLPSLTDDEKYLVFKKVDNAHRYYVKNERYTGKNYATNLFVGDYNYRLEDDEPADFSDLLKDVDGIERLAAFRCDVDNLGLAFTSGFSDEYSTISRVTSLSRQLSLFFKFYINKICRGNIAGEADVSLNNFYINDVENKEKKLVIVYSGGDDVFVVGAWIDVINFANDLRSAFRIFTCNKLTLSGGIGLFSSTYPISQIASQSGELEDVAKKYDNDSKDAIALFGIDEKTSKCNHVYHWEDFNSKVHSKVQFFQEVCKFDNEEDKTGKVFFSTSMMYKFKQLLEESQKDGKAINIARYAYTLARMMPKKMTEKSKSFKENIYNWAMNDRKALLTALEIIIYLNRKEAQND